MKKLLFLFTSILLISCSGDDDSSSSDSAEPILGVDNLSLVLKNKILKFSIQVNAPYEYSFLTRIMEFKEDGKRNIFSFRGVDDLPYGNAEGYCWNICGGGNSEIKIESPNYVEYINGNNITLIEGKLYYKSSITSTYKTSYEMSDSSLQEIEDFKEEVQQVMCDGGC